MEERGQNVPHGGFGRLSHDDGVISAGANGVVLNVVAGGDDGETVIGVVVVSSGFPGEAHASEGSELAGDIALEPEMIILEKFWDAASVHFEHLENNGFSALGLVEGGVVIAGAELWRAVEGLAGPNGEVSWSV